jgi:hypothetical protein
VWGRSKAVVRRGHGKRKKEPTCESVNGTKVLTKYQMVLWVQYLVPVLQWDDFGAEGRRGGGPRGEDGCDCVVRKKAFCHHFPGTEGQLLELLE